MRKLLAAALAVPMLALGAPAQAVIIYSNASLGGGITAANGTPFTFNAASPLAGTGLLSFFIDGYGSLDGQNVYQDDFLLRVNGSDVLRLSYDLGGGGSSTVFFSPVVTSITGGYFGPVHGPDDANRIGGQLQVTVPVALLAGANLFSLNYLPVGPMATGPGYPNGQPLTDEGWNITNVNLTGPIPEPATWGMMIIGFGMIGSVLRKRQAPVRVTYG